MTTDTLELVRREGVGERTWQAWAAVQHLFDEHPAIYRRLTTQIDGTLRRARSPESCVDVLAKMILRFEMDLENYTSSAIRWAVGKIIADTRRELDGRSRYRQEGIEAYQRHLVQRRRREAEEVVSAPEARDLVDLFQRRVLPTFSPAMRDGILDLMEEVGYEHEDPARRSRCRANPPVSRRTRYWRKKEAKKLACARLRELDN